MKDIRGNELKVGDVVHCIWTAEGVENDILATVCRTRGRGIKLVTDDGKTLTVEELEEKSATIIIQISKVEKPESVFISSEELDAIQLLRKFKWSGSISKQMNPGEVRFTL